MNTFIRYFRVLCLLLGTLLAAACGSGIDPIAQSVKHDCPEPMGYQFINGQILSMNAENSVYSSMVVENGRVVSVTNDQLETVSLPCHTLVDLKGKTVIPGLIDSHVHYVPFGSVFGAQNRSKICQKIDAKIDFLKNWSFCFRKNFAHSLSGIMCIFCA